MMTDRKKDDVPLKLRLKKTRIYSKPAPQVMMDNVVSEEVEKLPTFGAGMTI